MNLSKSKLLFKEVFLFSPAQKMKMAPSPTERSLSMTDVEELTRRCRTTFNKNFLVPFDFSAAVGSGNKKDIFKIVRPKIRKFKSHKSVGVYGVRKFVSYGFSTNPFRTRRSILSTWIHAWSTDCEITIAITRSYKSYLLWFGKKMVDWLFSGVSGPSLQFVL